MVYIQKYVILLTIYQKHVMYVENLLTALRKSLKNELYFEQLFEKCLVKDFKSWYRKLPIKAHMFYLKTLLVFLTFKTILMNLSFHKLPHGTFLICTLKEIFNKLELGALYTRRISHQKGSSISHGQLRHQLWYPLTLLGFNN